MLLGLTALGITSLVVLYKRRAIYQWIVYHAAYRMASPTERKRLAAHKADIYEGLGKR